MFLPVHPQSSQQSMMDFLKLGSGIEDGPKMTSPPLDNMELCIDKNTLKNNVS